MSVLPNIYFKYKPYRERVTKFLDILKPYLEYEKLSEFLELYIDMDEPNQKEVGYNYLWERLIVNDIDNDNEIIYVPLMEVINKELYENVFLNTFDDYSDVVSRDILYGNPIVTILDSVFEFIFFMEYECEIDQHKFLKKTVEIISKKILNIFYADKYNSGILYEIEIKSFDREVEISEITEPIFGEDINSVILQYIFV